MLLYFMLHDAVRFHDQLRPALTACWLRRSFDPCRALCAELTPHVQAYREQHRLGHDEPLFMQVARSLPFDRGNWRLLVGELLLYAAEEFPEIQTDPATLVRLHAPNDHSDEELRREQYAPIHQVHWGTRDLVLGGYYRPEHAGYNELDDTRRLADYLTSYPTDAWTTDRLRSDQPDADEEDLRETLEFARQCHDVLRSLYTRAMGRGQVVVCERI